ncbi:MAG: DEAD/DEAH box helicase family protein [Ignavibacteria bacterium]
MPFLYESFDTLTKFGAIPNIKFATIEDNLSPCFPIREYQIKSFARFDYFLKSNFDGKQHTPYHLLYNMATGSGKTLVMAGLMLYLYEKGYRNFIFFVNSTNIIKKTKDNFLNSQASKYLFSNKIVINGQEVHIKETVTFESADTKNINIKFTTIQQLHIDLNNTKENCVTYEDFKDKKIVLIADEAHHLSSATRNNNELFGSWEGTVLEILKQNHENILLEFTATIDYGNPEIARKYENKIIFKYDLAQFRIDGFSKEINLIRSEFDEQERIIQALILNLYRQELAASKNINLKPVILFKAKRTIKESEKNKENFHNLIDALSGKRIDGIRKSSTVSVIQKAFAFFNLMHISSSQISNLLKSNFKYENCISANNDEEAEQNQISLNTLEDEKNPLRAVFAVQKLNEGWDVLNLFDIVRLYEGQNTGGTNTTVGATTMSEAQLIGRGARYFPFALEEGQDKFTRKYDNEIDNDLKILEELYYHTKEDNRYISELKRALVETGIYEDDLETKHLTLKLDFQKTDFYKKGKVVYNKKIEKSYDNVKSFSDLGVSLRNYVHALSSGKGKVTGVFETADVTPLEQIESKDIKLSGIPKHIIRYALSQNPYFYFDNISKYFKHLESISNFIENTDYLSGLEITFKGSKARLTQISNSDFLYAIQGLLKSIETEIKDNLTEYEGSEYINDYIHKVFTNKDIRVKKDSEKSKGQEHVVADKPWYVYNANYGTSEEKSFVELFARRFESISKKFKNIYLIRNERELKIFDKLGRAFEPDFLLFAKQKKGKELTYQVFIEPKGTYIVGNDKWKENFLEEIRKEQKTLKIETDNYLITGVPFYNYDNENEFKRSLEEVLNIK